MNEPLKFVTYARRSSAGESKQIASIGDQERVFNEIISRDGLRVVTWYSESRSAKKPRMRPVFREMLTNIKKGKANAILIWHVNRLSRNPEESGELQQLLQDGVIKCVKTPERNYYPEDHALLFAVESAMANQYVRDLRRDVRRGTDEKAAKGWYPHKPKAGYELDPVTRELIPDPVRFPLLRRAWELMLSGDMSVPQVMHELNGLGYRTQRTRSGGNLPISRSSLYRLFADPFYAGVFEYYGEVFEGKHRPMVSKSEFKRVQRILGRPLRSNQRKNFHPFAGLIVCGVCGCLITAETHVKVRKTTGTNRSYTYYHCTGRRGCTKESIDESNLERQILRELEGCRLDPRFVDWALDVLKREEVESAKLDRITGATTTSSEVLITRRLANLYTMREDGELTREEFLDRKAIHQEELERIREAKEYALSKSTRDRESLVKLLTFGKDAYEKFVQGDKQTKRAVVREFSEEYVLTQGTLRIAIHPGLDRIRTFELQKSRNQQVEPDDSDPSNSSWRAMLDEIRKSVVSGTDSFPQKSYPESPSS